MNFGLTDMILLFGAYVVTAQFESLLLISDFQKGSIEKDHHSEICSKLKEQRGF